MSENFREFSRKQLGHGFQNLNSQFTCPGKHFAKSFLCKTDGIIGSSFYERKKLGRWLKVYDKGFETITYMSRETIWGTFSKKSLFSNRFCTLSEIFSTLGKGKSAGVVKTTFGVSRGEMWGFFIEKRMIFHTFLHFEQKHCWLLPNSYGRVSETSIYVSGEKFWEEKYEKRWFLRNFILWVKKLGNWVNKFRQGLPKVHSACPQTLLEEIKISERRMVP